MKEISFFMLLVEAAEAVMNERSTLLTANYSLFWAQNADLSNWHCTAFHGSWWHSLPEFFPPLHRGSAAPDG